jgi:hypothetical protein
VPDVRGANSRSAIGATDVKCQSSFFVSGKPSSSNRVIADSRSERAHCGAEAPPLRENASNPLRYD